MLSLFNKIMLAGEGVSYFISIQSLPNIIRESISVGLGPMYFIFLKVWMSFFGKSEIALRSMSLFWFAVLIFCLHHILIDALSISEKRAYKYLLFFVFNPILIYYATLATPHMMFLTLSVLSFYFLTKKNYLKYALFGIIAGLTHWTIILALIITGAYVATKSKKEFWRFFMSSSAIVLPVLLLINLKPSKASGLFISQVGEILGMLCFGILLSFLAVYLFRSGSKFVRGLIVLSGVVVMVLFNIKITHSFPNNLRIGIKNIQAVYQQGDRIFVKDAKLYFQAYYYFGDKVSLIASNKLSNYYNLVSKNNTRATLPDYPKKAFMLDRRGNFEAIAVY